MTFLLTYHGTLLCRDGAQLVHRPADHRTGVSPLRLDISWDRVRSDFDRSLRSSQAEIRSTIPSGDLAGHVMHVEADRRAVLLSREDRYLSAQPDGTVHDDRTHPSGWERFIPVQLEELDQLLSLRTQDWVLSDNQCVIPAANVRLSTRHGLWFGERHFDLRYQLPLFSDNGGRQLTLLRDGWRIVRARAFRPLLCYSAVGDPLVFEQLCLSLTSLLRWGRYRGDIHLVVDRDPTDVLRRVPGLDLDRIAFKRIAVTDRAGAIAARYSVLEWPELASFQPILIVDTDIIFDTDVAALLAYVTLSDKIVAPAEEFSPRRTAESAGAKLFGADGVDPGDALGFNAGSIGVPNLHAHGHQLHLIRRIIGNRSDAFGRGHFSWIDQPIANYVAQLTGGFETSHMRRYVRWGMAGIGAEGRRGLVHFWPHRGAAAKLRAMQEYAAALDDREGH